MPILEYFRPTPRRVVGFFGEEPPPEAVTALSSYEVREIQVQEIEDSSRLMNVAAIVFCQDQRRPNRITRDLREYADRLLWHDCRVFTRVLAARNGVQQISDMRSLVFRTIQENKLPVTGFRFARSSTSETGKQSESAFFPTVHILDELDDWNEVVRILRDFPPGIPPSLDVDLVDPNGVNLANTLVAEDVKLLQRAFHDCRQVILIENSDGLSGVNSYKAFSTAKQSYATQGASSPIEFFVKIGCRRSILQEYEAYRDRALEHIPFHLGPRLQLDRCTLGSKRGIIVSDYVSGAEPLRDCARDGRAVPAIANLFNSTLRVWLDNSKVEHASLQDFLNDRLPTQIPKHREGLIQVLGATKSLDDLRELIEQVPSGLIQKGVVHGDMHALNVMVRGDDAILIDFEKVDHDKPMLFDMASLEAGLLVSGFVGDERIAREVLISIEKVYDEINLRRRLVGLFDTTDASAWFFECVRQIRTQAATIELVDGHYAAILAVTLVRKACNERRFSGKVDLLHSPLSEEQIRALAYVIGERILLRKFAR